MTTSNAPVTLPNRDEVDPANCWDLSSLYADTDAWEADYAKLEAYLPWLAAFRGGWGEGPGVLRAFLDLDVEADNVLSRLYHYAQRRGDQDTSNGFYRGLCDRISNLWTKSSEATSWFRAELLSLPDETLDAYSASEELAPFGRTIAQVVRMKPYTLSEAEERLLAMSADLARAPSSIFGQLNDADLEFGFVKDAEGNEIEVTHGSYGVFLAKPDRDLRRRFFQTFYKAYHAHRNTLSATLASGVKKNIFYARARGFSSAREAALYRTEVPEVVYDSLIGAVHDNLPALHKYYDLRQRLLGLDDIHFYDLLVPVVPDIEVAHAYDAAVELVVESLKPLGSEYTATLGQGLLGGWVDRYENRGKRSGAYSASTYETHPYILLNYQQTELDHVYTLTHEAGHAMHSWHSNRAQTPQDAHYTIFVAEVASTFNEVLLTHHLLERTNDARMRAYIINREVDGIRSTLYRQAMFAEFEHRVHQHAEQGGPLSVDSMKGLYREILDHHFGTRFTIDPELEIEFMRIPHFYYNFYVFQYATGISAAYALANKVLNEGPEALEAYKGFLSAGSSKTPIDILKDAGVDMTSPDPVNAALAHFARRVDELDGLMS